MANLTYHLKQVSDKANANETAIAGISKQVTASASASSVLLGGNLALANYAVTKNFATVTYTGNGTSQSITTGISSVDFTVSGNGSGYWLDRSTNQVKNDAGTVQASGSCVCNVSKVHIKARNLAYRNGVVDGLRGVEGVIFTEATFAEDTTTSYELTSFDLNGFTLPSGAGANQSGGTYVAHQTLYTHIKWGLTNQNKFYVEAYNPVTREGMIYYIGSGIAGHEIPHSQGVELDLMVIKNTSDSAHGWRVNISQYHDYRLSLNETSSASANAGYFNALSDTVVSLSGASGSKVNDTNDNHILYYKAKSETWTIVQYQGTGASGNFIETVDVNGVARRPRRVIVKRTDSTEAWIMFDTERGADGSATKILEVNSSGAESTWSTSSPSIDATGFTLNSVTATNASGGQYIALVEFDTNGNGGDSYFDLPSDDSNLNVTAGTFTYTNGIGSNGYERSAESYTGAIDFAGIPDGLQWVYKTESGSFGYVTDKPTIVSDAPTGAISEYQFSTKEGKWYDLTGTALTTPVSFLPNPIMVVSETPMYIRYDDELAYEVAESFEAKTVTANEYKGKNAITAFINFDGTTYPADIKDSFNFNNVVRIGGTTGYKCYFDEPMDTEDYTVLDSLGFDGTQAYHTTIVEKTKTYVAINPYRTGAGFVANSNVSIAVLGGK